MTEAEIRAMVESTLLASGVAGDVFDDFIALAVANATAVAEEVRALFANEIARSIAGAVDPVAAAAAAEAVARDTATLVTQMMEAELKKIAAVIDEGVKAGLNPRQIARQLEVVQGLDAPRAAKLVRLQEYLEGTGLDPEAIQKQLDKTFESMLRDRRETIARTEARKITELVAETEARATSAAFKRWITTGDDRVSEVCAANEAAGVIPLAQSFPNGDRPPAHPNCRCRVVYLSDNAQLLAIQRRRAEEAKEATRIARGETDE